MRSLAGLVAVAILFSLPTSPLQAASFSRTEVRQIQQLNGPWQSALLPADASPDASTQWSNATEPNLVDPHPRPAPVSLWLQRDVDIPAEWADHRIFITLGGARYAPRVLVNGQTIAQRLDGWSPFRVELTRAITPGKSNRIQIVCRDLSAVIKPGTPWQTDGSIGKKKGVVIAPVGGYHDNFGLWDDLQLQATAATRLVDDDLIITTSTRRGTLTLQGQADGPAAAGASVDAVVMDGDQVALNLPASRVGTDGRWELSSPFPAAHYWSPEDPHLYQLIVRLHPDAGAAPDQITKRFGFREVWTQGPDIYLNGAKRHMLAESNWPPYGPLDHADIRKRLAEIKAHHCNAWRFHIGGWQEAWLDAADEIGLMIVVESPVYTDGDGFYDYNNPTFWQNYKDCIAGTIRRGRNHASVLMWSLGNEIQFMGNKKYDANLPKQQGDLARFAKAMDPTHLVTFEADLDPDNAYDVLGLHYPHELPKNFAYPNTANWLSQEQDTDAAGGMLGKQSSKFTWKRNKPLYIGEYLWVPLHDFSSGTIFYGDDSYLDRDDYLNKAKQAAWREQTLGYRRDNVSGLCPWGSQDIDKDYYIPIAAYLRSHDLRCFAGETYAATYDIYNDSDRKHELKLALTGLDIPARVFTLMPGAHEEVNIQIPSPRSSQPQSIKLDSVLTSDGQIVHQESHVLQVEPRSPLHVPDNFTLIQYDPTNKWPGSTSSLATLPQADVSRTLLLLAPGSLGAAGAQTPATFDTNQFNQFITRGGRAIVLDQQTLTPLGLDLSLVDHASTMTFPVAASYPLLKGIDPSALSFWRGDNFVTQHEIVRPSFGGVRAITVSGGEESLNQSPIIEISLGSGRIILIQALVGQKLATEPTAQILLQNAVDYLASLKPAATNPAIVLSDDKAFNDRLGDLHLQFTPATAALTSDQLASTHLLILHGGGDLIRSSASAIKQFHDAGGTIYWHQPAPDALASLADSIGATGITAKQEPAAAPISRRDDPLLFGVLREDLNYHTKPQSWTKEITLQTTASEVFLPDHAEAQTPTDIPLQGFTDLTGSNINNGALIFTSQGSATVAIHADEPGLHMITLNASTEGERKDRPVLSFDINNASCGLIALEKSSQQVYRFVVNIPAHDAQFKVSWTNGSDWGDGTSVKIASIGLGPRLALPEGATALVDSSALISLGGRSPVILDGIDWTKSGSNDLRGKRYASALLLNLGATFTTTGG